MADVVLLKCDIGSRAAVVLCPSCGRISRQILAASYSPDRTVGLIRPHTCPICETTYCACNPSQAEDWSAAFARYTRNADAYNQAVKDNYALQENAVAEPETVTPARSISVPAPVDIESSGDAFSAQNSYSSPNSAPQQQANRLMAENADDGKARAEDMSVSQKIVLNTLEEESENYSAESVEPPVTTEIDTENAPLAKENEGSVTSDDNLDRKIERWKRELLDTGKRNKMINYKETKRSTLRILEPDASVLFNKLAFSEKPLTFEKPINKDTDLRTYSMIALMETLAQKLDVQVGDIKTAGTIIEREKTLKNLRSKAKLAQEEQGTNIMYLCFGFIYWRIMVPAIQTTSSKTIVNMV